MHFRGGARPRPRAFLGVICGQLLDWRQVLPRHKQECSVCVCSLASPAGDRDCGVDEHGFLPAWISCWSCPSKEIGAFLQEPYRKRQSSSRARAQAASAMRLHRNPTVAACALSDGTEFREDAASEGNGHGGVDSRCHVAKIYQRDSSQGPLTHRRESRFPRQQRRRRSAPFSFLSCRNY